MDASIKTLTMLSIDPGTVIAGRYEVREKVGSGGMGMVFRVFDRHLNDDQVALKLLHPHLAEDEDVFLRFRNEVLVARSLSHPNIIRLHDIGRAEQGFFYISMEYVDGVSLKDRMAGVATSDLPPWSFDEALIALYQICCAVSYAHSKGIIHRDLKPANVMVSKSNDIKLGDFGTARIVGLSRNFTQTGQVIGTPDYMAPEQIQGQPLDAKCDIYALGIIGYELATGEKPFNADSAVALAFKHISEPLPRFASQTRGIPEWYEEIIIRAAEKDKEKRFASAADMVRALLEHRPDLSTSGTLFFSEPKRGKSAADATTSTRSGIATPTGQAADKIVADSTDARGFELGEIRSGGAEDARAAWSVGDGEGSSKSIHQPAPGAKRYFASAGIVLVVAGLGVLALTNPEVSNWLRQVVHTQSESTQLAHNRQLDTVNGQPSQGDVAGEPALTSGQTTEGRLGGTSGAQEEDLALAPTDVPAGVPEENDLRKQLGDELFDESQSAVGQSSVAAIAPQDATVASALVASSVSAPVLPAVLPAVSPTVSPTASPAVPPAVSPDVSSAVPLSALASTSVGEPKQVVEPAATETISATEVQLRDLSAPGKALRSVDLAKAESLEWRAIVSGFSEVEDKALRERVKKEIKAKIIKQRGGQILASINGQLLSRLPDGSLVVGGKLSSTATSKLSTGEYKLEVAHLENILSAHSFDVYRTAADVASQNQAQVVAGASGLPSAAQTPGGAPLATAAADVSSIASLGSTALTPEPTVTVPPAAAAESFAGSITVEGGQKALTLSLVFAEQKISGQATIEGVGDFRVEGEVFPRGFEMALRNTQMGIRLSGSRNGTALRGRYFNSTTQERGTWDARQ